MDKQNNTIKPKSRKRIAVFFPGGNQRINARRTDETIFQYAERLRIIGARQDAAIRFAEKGAAR